MRKPHYFKHEGKWHQFDPAFQAILGAMLFVSEGDLFAQIVMWQAIEPVRAAAILQDRIFDTERPRFGPPERQATR